MKKRFDEKQIMSILKEQEPGVPTTEICRKHGMSPASFYIVRPIENPTKAPALFLPIWPEILRTGPELFSGFQFDVV
jgi:hypothetical protein